VPVGGPRDARDLLPGQPHPRARQGLARRADCRCGIYAYHRPGTQTYFGEWEWTEGIVTAWGRIEAHAAGLRAQHARVEALGLPPSNEPTRRRSVETIADRLGVPLVPRDDLAAAAPAYGAPLPQSLLPEA
jgi:hypothetical protein